jgi:hypothetical protein
MFLREASEWSVLRKKSVGRKAIKSSVFRRSQIEKYQSAKRRPKLKQKVRQAFWNKALLLPLRGPALLLLRAKLLLQVRLKPLLPQVRLPLRPQAKLLPQASQPARASLAAAAEDRLIE